MIIITVSECSSVLVEVSRNAPFDPNTNYRFLYPAVWRNLKSIVVPVSEPFINESSNDKSL